MKTKSASSARPVLREEDIRAYAEHLFVVSGRIPNRDIENWLEAQGCLEANLAGAPRRRRRPAPARRIHGFTMPASDASLWVGEGEGG